MGSSYLPPPEQNVVNVGDEISASALSGIQAANPGLSQSNPVASVNYVTTALSGISASTSWGQITGTLASQSDLNSALSGKLASSVYYNQLPSLQLKPEASWGFSFPRPTNIPLALLDGNWVPIAAAGTTLGYDYGASSSLDASYDFSFYDDQSNWISLQGLASVGTQNVTVYVAAGNYDGTVTDSVTSVYAQSTGPNYAGNWDNPVTYAGFQDSSGNPMYRYVYLDGSGSFYTADNSNNPPY